MSYQYLLYRIEENVARISLNIPEKLNALNGDVWVELGRAFDEAIKDKEVHSILLAGEGRAFCSGFDISQSRENAKMEIYDQWEFLHEQREAMLTIWNSPKPVICAVQSHCLGGGFELANLADLIIAAEDARFGEVEMRYSLIPMPVLTYIIGARHAKELLFLTDPIDAAEAYRIGLVNKVVKVEELQDYSFNIAKRLAKMPTSTMSFTKRLMNKAMDMQGYEIIGDWAWDVFLLSKNIKTDVSKEFDEVCARDGLKAAYHFMNERFK